VLGAVEFQFRVLRGGPRGSLRLAREKRPSPLPALGVVDDEFQMGKIAVVIAPDAGGACSHLSLASTRPIWSSICKIGALQFHCWKGFLRQNAFLRLNGSQWKRARKSAIVSGRTVFRGTGGKGI
jgi:hypothetical protein